MEPPPITTVTDAGGKRNKGRYNKLKFVNCDGKYQFTNPRSRINTTHKETHCKGQIVVNQRLRKIFKTGNGQGNSNKNDLLDLSLEKNIIQKIMDILKIIFKKGQSKIIYTQSLLSTDSLFANLFTG